MADDPVKERPILFSGPMVQALLAGRKTQTRRVVFNYEHMDADDWTGLYIHRAKCEGHCDYSCSKAEIVDEDGSRGWDNLALCPHGRPGDRLWVREAFCLEGSLEYSLAESHYPRDGRPVNVGDDEGRQWVVPWYRATDGEPNIVPDDAPDFTDDRTRWKPSIHMPRWTSRILLEVADVRVQRVQEISEEDATAEGTPAAPGLTPGGNIGLGSARYWFQKLWNSINADRGYGWDVNPWVWAITFRRLKP